MGGLALALGCRTHPGVPVCTTPLLPEVVIPGPPVATAGPAASKLPTPPPVKTSVAKVTEPAPVVPPPDVPVVAPSAPEIKPMLVDAPRPRPDEDGFAPGPRVPAPSPDPVIVPVAVRRPPPVATPLEPGQRIGHAPDYRWVVGIADRHAREGHWTIRFADVGEDDPWGGKVRLMDDDRLRELSNGDLVYVRGEILAPASAAESAPAYPPFRVTAITVVEKAR
jgi:hypothetical protein